MHGYLLVQLIVIATYFATSGCLTSGSIAIGLTPRFEDVADLRPVKPGEVVDVKTRAQPPPRYEGSLRNVDDDGTLTIETAEGPRSIASGEVHGVQLFRDLRWTRHTGPLALGSYVRVAYGEGIPPQQVKGPLLGVVDGKVVVDTPPERTHVRADLVTSARVRRGNYLLYLLPVGVLLDVLMISTIASAVADFKNTFTFQMPNYGR